VRLQNVLVDSGLGRAIEVLRWLVPKGKPDNGFSRVSASAVHIGIAAQAGLPPSEISRVFDMLVHAGCIQEDGRDILIAPVNVLEDFSKYLDLKRRYEPTDSQQEAAVSAGKDRSSL